MKKIIVHICVIAGSLLLAIGSAGAGPLSLTVGPVASKPPLATFVRQGADDLVKHKHKRHGHGLDDGPNHVHQSSTSSSASSSAYSSRGRGSDVGTNHEHHGGDDRGGDHGGGAVTITAGVVAATIMAVAASRAGNHIPIVLQGD